MEWRNEENRLPCLSSWCCFYLNSDAGGKMPAFLPWGLFGALTDVWLWLQDQHQFMGIFSLLPFTIILLILSVIFLLPKCVPVMNRFFVRMCENIILKMNSLGASLWIAFTHANTNYKENRLPCLLPKCVPVMNRSFSQGSSEGSCY